MSSLPDLKARQVAEILRKIGFLFDNQKGNHQTYYHPTLKKYTTVPFHSGGRITKGTLRAIINQTGFSVDEFLSSRKK